MRRWRVSLDYFTAASGLRHWEGEVEAETVADACEKGARAARSEHLSIAEIVDVWVEPLGD